MDRSRVSRWLRGAVAVVLGLGAAGVLVHVAGTGCSGWDPDDPFVHNAPIVDQAIAHYDAGELEPAAQALTRYLGTGPCSEGSIGLTDMVRKRADGSFDLALTLFRLGERYGKPFGDEEEGRTPGPDGADEEPTEADRARGLQIDCALIVVRAIGSDPDVSPELRARAWYLAGNLDFLRRRYQDAVRSYDQALRIVPGVLEDAGPEAEEADAVGRDAAWNRSIALRRIEEQKDAGPDAPPEEPDAPPEKPDAPPDAGPDAEPDAGDDGEQGDEQNDEPPDAGPDGEPQEPDGGGDQDAGPDAGGDEPQDQQPDAGDGDAGEPQDPGQQPPGDGEPEEAPSDGDRRQGERVLDQFEEAPSYQEQEAKRRAGRGRRTMEDK